VGATVLAQGFAFALQMGTTVVLARLLLPGDFGLQAMVLAMTGFLALFRDAGLSVASVQRDVLTHAQTSTLFWINVAVGAALTVVAVATAPLLVVFYREPRLLWVTIAYAVSFLISSLAIQHRALLARTMRFVAIAWMDVLALTASTLVGIGMAAMGYSYWSLVGMAISSPLVTAAAAWIAMPWRPGRPRRNSGVWPMLRIGGTVTLNSLVVYLAFNTEKILLGRFWGADALGLYGRAYQLASQPVQQLNSAISVVAFPTLSRIQGDADHLDRSFLKCYSVVVSLTIPVALACALFAEEIVDVLLGPGWIGAAVVLRLLAPRVLASTLLNPLGWFLQASGRVGRSLGIALLIAPVVIIGIVAGLGHGPTGVALGYSTAMLLLVVPVVAWAKRGTGITTAAYWDSIKRPLVSGVAAAAVGGLFKGLATGALTPIPMLLLGLALSSAAYAWTLLVAMGQKDLYVDLLRQVFPQTRSASVALHVGAVPVAQSPAHIMKPRVLPRR
jgi:O-antigen/teichoic acid export membrane protein